MEWAIYGVAVLAFIGFALVVRSTLREKGFQSSLPHGECEARLGYGHGMMITCGKKTNHNSGTFWYCSQHPPKGGV